MIIIDENICDVFLKRFKLAIEDLKVGRADDFSTMINPLISKEDQIRVRDLVLAAKDEIWFTIVSDIIYNFNFERKGLFITIYK